MEKDKEIKTGISEKKITRKQAIQKVGITALTTASLVFLATRAKAQTSDTVSNAGRAPERGRSGGNAPVGGSSTESTKTNNGNHYGHDKK